MKRILTAEDGTGGTLAVNRLRRVHDRHDPDIVVGGSGRLSPVASRALGALLEDKRIGVVAEFNAVPVGGGICAEVRTIDEVTEVDVPW